MASRAIVIAFCLASVTFAQGPEAAGVRGDSGGTRRQLAEAEQLLNTDKPGEARKLLAKILEDSGDDLILVENGRYVAARWYAQRLLARLPAEELKLFRTGIDDAANDLLEEGRRQRDPEPLQELIARYFVSRAGADALVMLGELAFERGEFELAEYYWARLLSEEDRPPRPLPNLPTIAARRILAVHFQGDPERTGKLFQEFFKTHADATGRLAGRDGKLEVILRDELQRPMKPQSAQTSANDWPTLGGSPSRTGSVPGSLARLPVTPLWSVPIPGRGEGGPVVNAVRRVGFHPILDGTHVYLADPHHIHRFDLADGKMTAVFDGHQKDLSDAKSSWQNADFTLTQAHGRVYARIGAAGVLPGDANRKTAMASRLVGVPLKEKLNLSPRILPPPVGDDAIAGWEGAPLAADGKLFAVFTRLDGGRLVQAIACYDDRNPKPLWVTDICESGVAEAEGRERQELLTLAGPNVVFCSQSGVIAAVNFRTGKPAWSYRYQRIPKVPFDGRPRDLSPPVAAGSRVFVAPNDSDKLFAFDAESGRLLWHSGPILVDHLIGVADGKVIAAIAGPQRGLRAYHAATGSCDPPHGWMQHDDPQLSTVGRGLIAGKHIAWPTQTGLYLIQLENGDPARPPLPGVHGNLAYADGKLAVADAKMLSLFAWPAAGPAIPDAKPITRGEIKTTNHSKAEKLAAPIDYGLKPFISSNPKLKTVLTLQPGGVLLTPSTGEWSGNVFEPQLLSDISLPDHVAYYGEDAFLVYQTTLVRRCRKQAIWSIDLRLPVSFIHVNADRIIVRIGCHHLAALDAVAGRLLWILDGLKRNSLRPNSIASAPRFDSQILAEGKFVLARLSNGRCWLIDADSGVVKHEWPATATWPTTPVKLPDGVLAFAAGPGTVTAIHPQTGKTVWTFEANSPAGLAGAAPQIANIKEHVIAAFARNHGFELNCIVNGTAAWKSAASFTERPHLNGLAVSGELLFVPMGDRVAAFNLSSGEMVWETLLPKDAYVSIRAFDRSIVLVPRFLPLNWNEIILNSIPNWRSIINCFKSPILFLDTANGQIRDRGINIQGPIVSTTMTVDSLWLATPQTIYRVK